MWQEEGIQGVGGENCGTESTWRRGEDNIKMDFQKAGVGGFWTGLLWLRIGTVGGHL